MSKNGMVKYIQFAFAYSTIELNLEQNNMNKTTCTRACTSCCWLSQILMSLFDITLVFVYGHDCSFKVVEMFGYTALQQFSPAMQTMTKACALCPQHLLCISLWGSVSGLFSWSTTCMSCVQTQMFWIYSLCISFFSFSEFV